MITRITGLILFTCLMMTQYFLCEIALAETINKKVGTPDKKAKSIADKVTEKKQFDDWVLKCGGKGIKDDPCFIMQDLFIKKSGQRLLRVAVGYLGPDNKPMLFLTTPLGIFLPPGIAISIDDRDGHKTPFRVCIPKGCKASIMLNKKLIGALKKGNQMKVAFFDGGTQKQITVEISLTGFSKGFGALGAAP
jgi:invasion protein IalB